MRSTGGLARVCLVKELSGELGVKGRRKPTLNRASQCHYLFEVRTQEETGLTQAIEPSDRVGSRPTRSSTDVF